MKNLIIRLETKCSAGLDQCGVYRYAESSDFQPLLLSFCADDGPMQTVDLTTGRPPPEILDALTQKEIIKWSLDGTAARICLSRWMKDHGIPLNAQTDPKYIQPEGWRSTMVWCAALGLPTSFAKVCQILGIEQEEWTLRIPNAGECILWKAFQFWSQEQLEAERKLLHWLSRFPQPDWLWEEYFLDQKINDRGIGLDVEFVQQVLQRQEKLSPTARQKYYAMEQAVCADGRIRGTLQFYGTPRTGRWSSQLVQNLPKTNLDLSALTEVKELVRAGKWKELQSRRPNVPYLLSQMLRTALVPEAGKEFIVADYNAVEPRVLAWLAGEHWRNQLFAQGGDLYCASASRMFHVLVEKEGQNSHLRQKGKIAELALGYGGSVQALKKMMGTAASEIPEKELSDMVSAWRRANPHITAFWRQVNRAAKQAIRFHDMGEAHGIRFYYDYGFLCIQLPSGRKLVYADPRVETDPLGWDHITFLSGDEWKRQETYGARLVENMVQGIARDLLAHAMRNLSSSSIVLHVHDEIVVEEKGLPPEEVCKQMCRLPDWARGLLTQAEGFAAPFYCKS